MSSLPPFQHLHFGSAAALPTGLRPPPPLAATSRDGKQRTKIWELSPSLHCSVIGTCLSAGELRQFFVRMGNREAKTTTDHVLHRSGVLAAKQHDTAGKLLHKALDKRHETIIRRFSKAATADEVRALWLEGLDRGDIPGAYWAVLTHPAADRPLIEEAFGEVHMLSHMVGSSNRLDLSRLRALERTLSERDEKIARQEARLQERGTERSQLIEQIAKLEAQNLLLTADEGARAKASVALDEVAQLRLKLQAEKDRATTLATKLQEAENRACRAEERAAEGEDREGKLRLELEAAEEALDPPDGDAPSAAEDQRLRGRVLLYVGGRPKLVGQIRAWVAQNGGVLLDHDGGVEHNSALLPGLVSRAEAVLFPVDCISHTAAGQVKRLCREAGKEFLPLRTASLASFLAATRTERGAMATPQVENVA